MKKTNIRAQVKIRVTRPRSLKITSQFLNAVLEEYIRTGELAKGVEIEAIIWDNTPDKTYEYGPDRALEILEKLEALGIRPKFAASDGED